MVHKQFDILDPQEWPRKIDMDKYHKDICIKMRTRVDQVLSKFSNGEFPFVSDWTFTYVPVPKMAPFFDCCFWCMLYLENYNPILRLMETSIQKVLCFILSAILSNSCILSAIY